MSRGAQTDDPMLDGCQGNKDSLGAKVEQIQRCFPFNFRFGRKVASSCATDSPSIFYHVFLNSVELCRLLLFTHLHCASSLYTFLRKHGTIKVSTGSSGSPVEHTLHLYTSASPRRFSTAVWTVSVLASSTRPSLIFTSISRTRSTHAAALLPLGPLRSILVVARVRCGCAPAHRSMAFFIQHAV